MAGEAADVAFIGGDDVKLELLMDTVRDVTSFVITETISLEEDWASVEVSIWVDWLTLGECKVMTEDGSLLVLDV